MSRLKNRTARLRQLEELLLLRSDGMSVPEIADHMGVHRRTVYRDLDFLSGEGVPIWQEGGCFGINRARYLATVRLSFHEAVTLTLAGLLLSRTLDESNPHAITALRSLAVTLPEPFTAHLDRAAARIEDQKANHRQVAVLESIAEGWGTGHKVKVTYHPPNGDPNRERVIEPYMIEPTHMGLYVIGHDDRSGAVRTFKLERLESARVLPDTYTIPKTFDPETYLAGSWRIMTGEDVSRVILVFSPQATPFVQERVWHPSQKLRGQTDGGCELQVQVCEPVEMLPWIRSWGSQVEVVAPDWLRERVADELRFAAERYLAAEMT